MGIGISAAFGGLFKVMLLGSREQALAWMPTTDGHTIIE
jgi:hypothetical protein